MKNITLHIRFAYMKKYLHNFFVAFFILLFVFPSCRKADRDTDISTGMVTDNAFSTYFFNDLFIQLHTIALSDSSLNAIGSFFVYDTACIDTITHTNIPGLFPDTVTVNYGPAGGTSCTDGNQRSGKLKFVFRGKYGGVRHDFSVLPENYRLNGNKTEGNISITCRARNSSNNLYFSIEIINGRISNDSVNTSFFAPCGDHNSTFQREWLSGESTMAVNDDVFMLSGSYGGTATKGTSYQCEITSPLKIQADCKWISGGKENLLPLNLSPRIVDYGNGCDNMAVVNINGKDYDVSLLP